MSDSMYLPCPFCGSSDIDPTFWASTDNSGPGCNQCGATGEPDGWNKRVLNVERLVDLMDELIYAQDIAPDDPKLYRAFMAAFGKTLREDLDQKAAKRAGLRALILAALGVEATNEQ